MEENVRSEGNVTSEERYRDAVSGFIDGVRALSLGVCKASRS